VTWPQLTDYHEAVQNPSRCFRDPELRRGRPRLDGLGLPRVVTGNFASVYQVQTGAKEFAVRCFLTAQAEREQRYAAIATHLKRARLPYTVDFEFEREGIRVGKQWFPILKMEWISGTPLQAYVEEKLDEPSELLSLARKLIAMMEALRKVHIAHGDLQHGNILVAPDGSVRLIDYDGMWVPALSGFANRELGHANYQHPRRDDSTFGPTMDNFSGWVIVLAIAALSVDPYLWQESHGGDERLLFGKDDLANPDLSSILTTLSASYDAQIVEGVKRFSSMAAMRPDAVPPVSEAILPEVVSTDLGSTADEPWWLEPTEPTPQESGRAELGSEWVLTHLPKSKIAAFAGALLVPRLVAGAWLASLAVVSSLARVVDMVGVLAGLAIANLVGPASLFALYIRRDEVHEKKALRRRLNQERRSVKLLEGQVSRLEAERRQLSRTEQSELASMAQRRGALGQQERDEIRRLSDELQEKSRNLRRQIDQLSQDERAELQRRLQQLKEAHLGKELARYGIDSASIQGIGPALKAKLKAHGIRTAADLEGVSVSRVSSGYRRYTNEVARLKIRGRGSVRIDGIGPAKARALDTWRKNRAESARSRLPNQLPVRDRTAIADSFRAKKQGLQASLQGLKPETDRQIHGVRTRYVHAQRTLDGELREARRRHQTARRSWGARMQQTSAQLRSQKWQLTSAKREVARYRRISFIRFLALVVLFVRR
jgi:serine/threonine protein kinase